MKGAAIGRIAGILAIMIAMFRSIPAHNKPEMLAKDMSDAEDECSDRPP